MDKNIFIHIPKNGGKYIRDKIKKNKENKIIKGYWGVKGGFDLAHIPYVKREKYIDKRVKYKYITYSRDPYDRLISAYFYKNRENGREDFKKFCKEELRELVFNNTYDRSIIHYYPQYLFICNRKEEKIDIKIKRINAPKKYDIEKYYDDDMLKVVNDVYKQDFKKLNYKMFGSIIEWRKSEQL